MNTLKLESIGGVACIVDYYYKIAHMLMEITGANIPETRTAFLPYITKDTQFGDIITITLEDSVKLLKSAQLAVQLRHELEAFSEAYPEEPDGVWMTQ